MREKAVRHTLISTLVLTLLLPVNSTAQSQENDPAAVQPLPPALHHSRQDQPTPSPLADANPRKSPGHLSAPFPMPVPKDLPRRVPIREAVSLHQQSDPIIGLIQQIDESMVLGYLENLTSFGPRVTETGPCQAAGDYIYDEFQAMGLDVRYHDWSFGGRQDRNIEATLHGSDPLSGEIYVICAHYDSVPGAPGADDNGSGTAAVLSAAFVMSQHAFDHTIRFVTFSGEEQGLLGSHEYVEEAYAAGDNIVATLNADMIGFAVTQNDEQNIIVYANGASTWLSEYTTDVNTLYSSYIDLTVNPAGASSGSDHWYFWQYGYDALFYFEYNFNDYYHSPQDIIANMNLTYDVKVTRLVIATLAELALIAPPIVQPCELDKLTASDASADDLFGVSVSISGDRAVVGAHYDDYAGTDSGSAYVFRWDDNGTPSDPSDDFWGEEQKLTASDAAPGDYFGYAVSINGDRAIVGAYYDDDAGDRSGSAYVFRRDDNGTPLDPGDDFWVQEDKLTAADAAAFDGFGNSVSISGDRVVVGAFDDDDAGTRSGSAYVFRRDDNGTTSDPSDDFWVQEDKLTASDAAAGDQFGFAVSVSGDRAVVGADRNDDACPGNPNCDSGSAYVFRRNDNATPSDPSDDFWVQEDKLTPPDAGAGDEFAHAVSISGDRILVGANWGDAPGASDSGSAYVFSRDDNSTPLNPSDDFWVQEDKLTALDAAASDHFGYSVSVSGDRAVVGAWGNEDAGERTGSAYVFRRTGNRWSQDSKLTAPDATAGDVFGVSVSISGDRSIVGAHDNDDACPGDPSCDSGSAYVFGVAGDCNRNGIDDVCDIRDGTSPDKDGDGVPDECTCERGSRPEPERLAGTPLQSPLAGGTRGESPQGATAAAAEDPVNVKNRFISIKAADPGRIQAIRVRFVSLPPPFDVWNYENTGSDFFAGVPREACENSGKGLETAAEDCPDALPARTFWTAPLLCGKETAHMMDWHGQCPPSGNCVGGLIEGEPCSVDDDCAEVVHLYHEGIVPSGVYDVQVVDPIGDQVAQPENCYSSPLTMTQAKWGDVCGPSLVEGACTAVSDGIADVTNDVLGALDKFTNVSLLQKARADIGPGDDGINNGPDFMVDVAIDVLRALAAFTGVPYPYQPGDPCEPGLAVARD